MNSATGEGADPTSEDDPTGRDGVQDVEGPHAGGLSGPDDVEGPHPGGPGGSDTPEVPGDGGLSGPDDAEGPHPGGPGGPDGLVGPDSPYSPGTPDDLDGPVGVDYVRAVFAGAGFDLTAGELADALWLALHHGPPGGPDEAAPAAATPAPGTDVGAPPHDSREPRGPAADDDVPSPEPVPAPVPSAVPMPPPHDPPPPARRPVYALAGGPRGGGAATAVRVPGVPGLPNPLSVTRALRPFKRRVSSLHRYELDEAATAEAIADSGALDVVLRPERARWLDLVLAVDDAGISLRVWQDTLTELQRVLATSGIFRTVRRCTFDSGRHEGVPEGGGHDGGEREAAAAVVDGNRTVVLAVTDGVGPAWRSGAALRTLAGWARKAPTAVLQPLPLRLWPGTALSAERMRVRSSRPAPANHFLHAYDPWLPARLAPAARLPVPVLELGDWSLAPWAALIASHGGAATLRVVDADPPRPLPAPAPAPARAPASAADRLLAFQDAVSPEAYALAGHLAAVDPLTLPVMRVVQSAALPGTSPSCLSEVLLSGLMRVERPLAGFDVFAFDPDVRSLLRMVVQSTQARRTVDAVSDFIAPRLGRARDFPALIAARSGTLELPHAGSPFARMQPPDDRAALPAHPAPEYVVGVHRASLPTDPVAGGYLVADRLVLTSVRTHPAAASDPSPDHVVRVHPALGGADRWLDAEVVREMDGARLLWISDPAWDPPPLPPVRWGRAAARAGERLTTVAAWSSRPGFENHSARVETMPLSEAAPRRSEAAIPQAHRVPGRTLLQAAPGTVSQGAAVFEDGVLTGLVMPFGVSVEVRPVLRFLGDGRFYEAVGMPEVEWLGGGTPPRSDADEPAPTDERVSSTAPTDGLAPTDEPAPTAGYAAVDERPRTPPDEPAPPDERPPVVGPAPPDGRAGEPTTGGGAVPGGPTALPDRPFGLTLDEEDVLRQLVRLTSGGSSLGLAVVLGGPLSSSVAVAAEFAHRHGPSFGGPAEWYARVDPASSGSWTPEGSGERLVVLQTDGPAPALDPALDDLVSRVTASGAVVIVIAADTAATGGRPKVLRGADGTVDPGPQPAPSEPTAPDPAGSVPREATASGSVPPPPGADLAAHPRSRNASPDAAEDARWDPHWAAAERIADTLTALLPWISPRVSFPILQTLWEPEPLALALGRLHSERIAHVDWNLRQVILDDDAAPRLPQGREPAVRLLTAAYANDYYVRDSMQGGDYERARHVAAFAGHVPAAEDTPDLAGLYHRAGRTLLTTGHGRPGMLLCERAWDAVARVTDRRTVPVRLSGSRTALVDEAAAAGLDAFLALSGATLAAYAAATSWWSRPGAVLVELHRKMTWFASPGSTDAATLEFFEEALSWCESRFGRTSRLTVELAAWLDQLPT